MSGGILPKKHHDRQSQICLPEWSQSWLTVTKLLLDAGSDGEVCDRCNKGHGNKREGEHLSAILECKNYEAS